LKAGASIWFENGGVVGPGLKTRGVASPKDSADGGTYHRIEGIIPRIFINYL